jgi:excisionase family DNA binding protein
MLNKAWWRPDEVAEHFGVSMDTVYRWVRQGDLEGCKIKGVLRITRASLEALIAKGLPKNKANFL